MSMPTDEEMEQLLEEDGPITQKIKQMLSAAEERILKQVRPVVEKIEKHDEIIKDDHRLVSNLTKGRKR